ncbi:hypothetical protein Tco_0636778 [Tanacetum coccineum]
MRDESWTFTKPSSQISIKACITSFSDHSLISSSSSHRILSSSFFWVWNASISHSGPSTRDVSPRLCYPPRRAPQRSEAFHRLCAAPLSTLPSRKRCTSPVDSVPSSTPVIGSLAPTSDDLLPPRKRFRDSYSSEASIEEDAEVGLIEIGADMELGIGDGDDVKDHVEIDPRDVRDDT